MDALQQSPPASPAFLLRSLRRNRELVRQLAWQEIVGRYRGSMFGLRVRVNDDATTTPR